MSRISRIVGAVVAIALALLPLAVSAYTAGTVGEFHGNLERDRLRCGRGEYITGLNIKAGTYVDGIALQCAVATGRSTLGSPKTGSSFNGTSSLASFFPGVTSRRKTVFCPQNYVLSGIKVREGDYVDRIMSIRCTRFRGTRNRYRDVGMGGDGGAVARPYCSAARGDYVTELDVLHGSWLDRMTVRCQSQ